MHKQKKKNSRAGTERAETVRHSAASASMARIRAGTPASDRPPYTARSELNRACDFNTLYMQKTPEEAVSRPVSVRRPTAPVTEGWEDFLGGHPWTLIAHLSFAAVRMHPDQAARRFSHWIIRLERQRGRRIRGPIVWVRGSETQQRGVPHFHVLLANTGRLRPFAAMRIWEDIAGGTARIFRYDPGRGGIAYVVKGGSIDLSRTWFG